jgi:hypothetical protein
LTRLDRVPHHRDETGRDGKGDQPDQNPDLQGRAGAPDNDPTGAGLDFDRDGLTLRVSQESATDGDHRFALGQGAEGDTGQHSTATDRPIRRHAGDGVIHRADDRIGHVSHDKVRPQKVPVGDLCFLHRRVRVHYLQQRRVKGQAHLGPCQLGDVFHAHVECPYVARSQVQRRRIEPYFRARGGHRACDPDDEPPAADEYQSKTP